MDITNIRFLPIYYLLKGNIWGIIGAFIVEVISGANYFQLKPFWDILFNYRK